MSRESIRIAVVGTGNIAGVHATALRAAGTGFAAAASVLTEQPQVLSGGAGTTGH